MESVVSTARLCEAIGAVPGALCMLNETIQPPRIQEMNQGAVQRVSVGQKVRWIFRTPHPFISLLPLLPRQHAIPHNPTHGLDSISEWLLRLNFLPTMHRLR